MRLLPPIGSCRSLADSQRPSSVILLLLAQRTSSPTLSLQRPSPGKRSTCPMGSLLSMRSSAPTTVLTCSRISILPVATISAALIWNLTCRITFSVEMDPQKPTAPTQRKLLTSRSVRCICRVPGPAWWIGRHTPVKDSKS